ncbi:hypothetical protein GQ44DRAFT_725979 [Phaeosphaeriaceae sp. PMI808]|nr:hypothetical protein GQ44DRAFT_725979 [Phaeosphaeriaceae sp. PMI808]
MDSFAFTPIPVPFGPSASPSSKPINSDTDAFDIELNTPTEDAEMTALLPTTTINTPLENTPGRLPPFFTSGPSLVSRPVRIDATPTTLLATSSAPKPEPDFNHSGKLNGGQIAGITLGVMFGGTFLIHVGKHYCEKWLKQRRARRAAELRNLPPSNDDTVLPPQANGTAHLPRINEAV